MSLLNSLKTILIPKSKNNHGSTNPITYSWWQGKIPHWNKSNWNPCQNSRFEKSTEKRNIQNEWNLFFDFKSIEKENGIWDFFVLFLDSNLFSIAFFHSWMHFSIFFFPCFPIIEFEWSNIQLKLDQLNFKFDCKKTFAFLHAKKKKTFAWTKKKKMQLIWWWKINLMKWWWTFMFSLTCRGKTISFIIIIIIFNEKQKQTNENRKCCNCGNCRNLSYRKELCFE